MKIAIACDHAGYEYKEKLVAFLRQKGYEVKDFGTHSAESMDFLSRYCPSDGCCC